MYLIYHNHKKRKDSLEGSLVRVLFVAELEFPKILVPSLPQNTSNVIGALIHLDFIVVIFMRGVNYVINGCSFLRTTP